MKKLIFTAILALASFANAESITISGTAPTGVTIEASNTYMANSRSWFCTHLKLNESANFERLPNIYSAKVATTAKADSFSLSYATALDKCDATLHGSDVRVVAPGFDDNNSWISISSSENNVSEVQRIDCQKMVYGDRVDNVCSANLHVGPDGKINLAITIQQ